MEIKRFFVDKTQKPTVGTALEIAGEEFHHAIKVSHYKKGYRLILSNGDGFDYYCAITDVCKSSFTCLVESAEKNANELGKSLALYLCGIEKSDIAVQKATEIGATEIRFMVSKYTNAKTQNVDRLKKIALEAAKQCGRAVVPEIYPPIPFEEAVRQATERFDRVVFCYECAKDGYIREVTDKTAASYALIVGSEGGFSQEEVEFARSLGAKVVTLGRRILRAETACIAGLVLLADEMERYENSGN